jgi:hypothetical protein
MLGRSPRRPLGSAQRFGRRGRRLTARLARPQRVDEPRRSAGVRRGRKRDLQKAHRLRMRPRPRWPWALGLGRFPELGAPAMEAIRIELKLTADLILGIAVEQIDRLAVELGWDAGAMPACSSEFLETGSNFMQIGRPTGRCGCCHREPPSDLGASLHLTQPVPHARLPARYRLERTRFLGLDSRRARYDLHLLRRPLGARALEVTAEPSRVVFTADRRTRRNQPHAARRTIALADGW